ncbi:MAG TPA: hypothetical protein DCG19_03705 [Cryomorphaceae bacterium]|nr:hypothetical protein [Owenweeksia sp.]MBF98698.1 hypothetical protein [Owenweeksia sp.]HAD96485.1 hypothetical protein [Cryomorphaceae bacterium]HBF22123.1 hypothetical protein [Cryomorphaceae bacterium]HCQ15002.1 hypothetical protein [Cryomorphaceae bacterium]
MQLPSSIMLLLKRLKEKPTRTLTLMQMRWSFSSKRIWRLLKRETPTVPYEEKIEKNNSDYWFSTVKVPLRIDGETHVLGVSTDVTELKDLEQTLKIRNSELEEFLYNTSHDLRGPVSSLLGIADLMEKEKDFQNLGLYGEMVGELARKLDHTLHKLLEVRKVTSKKLEPKTVDLEKTLVKWIKENYGEKKVTFDIDFSKATRLEVDEELFLLVIQKVMNNACTYHNTSHKSKEVKIYSGKSTTHFHIWIEDNGDGIEKEHLPRITQMFYKGTINSTGSGLGLYVGQKVMEQLNGYMSIHSIPTVGTTVELSFPLGKV